MSIRKIFTLIVSLMLATGCVVDIEDETEHYEYVAEDGGDAGYYSGGGSGDTCNPRPETLVITLPDGSTTMLLTMPIMCDSQPYLDGGDPPPEINPDEKVVNPYDDTSQLSPSLGDSKF